jgi:hypothetical protein
LWINHVQSITDVTLHTDARRRSDIDSLADA